MGHGNELPDDFLEVQVYFFTESEELKQKLFPDFWYAHRC